MSGGAMFAVMGVPVGGGGGVLPFTDAFARADGDLGGGWIYTAGKWTISSNKAITTPTVNASETENGNMETGDPPTNWIASSATLSSVADERTGGAGSKAMNALASAANGGALQVNALAGGWYTLDGWIKNVDATNGHLLINSLSVGTTVTATDWTLTGRSCYLTGSQTLYVRAAGSGKNARFDDVHLRPLTLSECLCVRNLGTPNARADVVIAKTGGGSNGLVLCLDSQSAPQNAIFVYTDDTYLYYQRLVGGTLQAPVIVWINTDQGTEYTPASMTLGAELYGQILRVFNAGVQVGSDVLISDAGIINNTFHGLFNSHPLTTLDSYNSQAAISPVPLNGSATNMFNVVTAAADLWSSAAPNDWLGRPMLLDTGAAWMAIYRQGPGHNPHADDVFHCHFSTDEGANWGAADTFTDTNPVTGFPLVKHGLYGPSDAFPFTAPNGDLIIHALEIGGTYQYRSTAASAGAVWTDEGIIESDTTLVGAQGYAVIGSVIYALFLDDPDANETPPWSLMLYKSTDNGANWVKVADVDTATTCNECALISTGGSVLLVIMRDTDGVTTYKYTSSDLGLTWSARTEVAILNSLQRPRLYTLAGGVILIGRDDRGSRERPVVWFSADGGVNWVRKFYPDATLYTDAGYSDILQRTGGNIYMLSYGGTVDTAVVRRTVFGMS